MVHSIDEMSFRLLRNECDPESAVRIAGRIKEAIRERVGEVLRCSIGLAPNLFLAKVASKMQKPDGLVVVQKEELPQRLYGLALDDLHGIGAGTIRRLHRAGVSSVEQLCALDPRQLESIYGGIVGRRLWYALRGHDSPPRPAPRRTVGHSHVLPPALRTREAAHEVLTRLIHKAAARMRNLGCAAKKMSLEVGFSFAEPWFAWTHLGLCQDTLSALEGLTRLWPRCPQGSPLRVGVTFFELTPCSCATLPLFSEDAGRIRLSQTMDQINQACGRQAVFFGGMFGAENSAPLRIAFTQIPDLEVVT
jgi:DNA polymerase-4